VIEKCRKLPLLGALEKSTLDIDTVPAAFLGEFQVVVAWDVFYSFDTDRLIRFFDKIRAARSSLIICSSQIIGPLRGLSYLWKSRLYGYAKDCAAGRLRDHGYKCSLGYYRTVAGRLGLECHLLSPPPPWPNEGDSYFFIRISSPEEISNLAPVT